MRRSSFRRPQIERKPVVLTRIAPQDRRGVMAPAGGAVAAVPKPKTYRNRAHLDRVASLPCVDCGADDGTVVAAHVKGRCSPCFCVSVDESFSRFDLGEGLLGTADDEAVDVSEEEPARPVSGANVQGVIRKYPDRGRAGH